MPLTRERAEQGGGQAAALVEPEALASSSQESVSHLRTEKATLGSVSVTNAKNKKCGHRAISGPILMWPMVSGASW